MGEHSPPGDGQAVRMTFAQEGHYRGGQHKEAFWEDRRDGNVGEARSASRPRAPAADDASGALSLGASPRQWVPLQPG